MKDRTSWTYISGLIAARQERLLSASAFSELVAMRDPAHITSRVRQTTLFANLSAEAGQGAMAMASQMDRLHLGYIQEIIAESPPNSTLRFFTLPHEWYEFKVYAKKRLAAKEQPAADAQFSSRWADIWSGSDARPEDVPFAKAAEVVKSLAPHTETPLSMLDGVCDGRLLAQIADLARAAEHPGIRRAIAEWVELSCAVAVSRARMQNVDMEQFSNWFARWFPKERWWAALCVAPPEQWSGIVREGLLPYTDDISVEAGKDPAALVRLEQEVMNRLTDQVHPARWTVFGPERVFAYLWELMVEASNLKIVLGGTLGGLSPQTLGERLRSTYV